MLSMWGQSSPYSLLKVRVSLWRFLVVLRLPIELWRGQDKTRKCGVANSTAIACHLIECISPSESSRVTN